jgi:hypothetical protein
MTGPMVRLTLRVLPGSNPIAGEFEDEAGETQDFRGWIELAAKLEARRQAAALEKPCDPSRW